ncbi:hypothetical protein QR98_0102250 [Sarcoptes scabiei]|uniref:FHA domain-containing protein n=1 Tax=Sarcoptes scabiei TaxID=52283 RepID=A0A132AKX4_SARSC|nr:hypothetical protein QR98_0102250 [Sarcoptes scabiei]
MKIYLKTLSDESKNVEFAVGKHTLGRGPLLDCTDKKVSRTHASIEITKNGEVIITSLHVNPTFYFGQDSESSPKLIKKDNSLTLSNGDIFGFQAQQYKYQVIIEGINGNATVKNVNSGHDFVASDDDLWRSESEDDYKPKRGKKRAANSESDSDWEVERKSGRGGNRAANRGKKSYAESESDSDSDWGKKKKKRSRRPPKREASKKAKKTIDSEEEEDEDLQDELDGIVEKA